MDAGNMLKPALARGEMQCVGATTLDEYRKGVEKDPALERRFQSVLVEAPNVEDTVTILRGLKERFEVFHGIRIKDSALLAANVLLEAEGLRPEPVYSVPPQGQLARRQVGPHEGTQGGAASRQGDRS